MARIRTIKPEFWTDEKVVELSFPARLLFIGLWNFADDAGRLVHSPKRMKMQIFPSDSVEIEKLVQELVDQELVEIYTVGKDSILWIPTFLEHQKIDRPTPSKLPASPRENSSSAGARVQVKTENPPREVEDFSSTSSRVVDESSRSLAPEGKGKEGIQERIGSEGTGTEHYIPEGLDLFQYASALLEMLVLPSSKALLGIVASSIQALAKSKGATFAETTAEIRDRAKRHRAEGAPIDRFWFENGTFASDEIRRGGRKSSARSETDRIGSERAESGGRYSGAVGVEDLL